MRIHETPNKAVILSEAFYSGVEGSAFPSRKPVKNFRLTTLNRVSKMVAKYRLQSFRG
jgi:hypothetical protein